MSLADVISKVSVVLLGCFLALKAEAEAPKNLVLIVVDTLGSEHLSVYNPTLTTSPRLKQLGESGVVFKKAFSTAPWTKPSLASLFTGKLPSQHKVIGLNSVLMDEQQTLAETFKSKGFETAGVISHTLIDSKNGFSQGFDSYQIVDFKGNIHNAITSEKVTALGVEKLRLFSQGKKPFLLFLHYFDPHYNFKHHEQFNFTAGYKGKLRPGMDIRKLRAKIPTLTKEDIAYMIGLYREEIAYTDFHIGQFLDEFRKLGLDQDSLVVLTADHGEEFMRHGKIGHTSTLFDELIHVPLIISHPGSIKPGLVEGSVSSADLAPTIWDLFGIDTPPGLDGRSLKEQLQGKDAPSGRDLISEVDFKSSHIQAYKLSVIRDQWKLVFDKPTSSYELYDRSSDPEELKNLFSTSPAVTGELKAVIEKYLGTSETSGPSAPELERSPEEVEQLKSLGYM